MSRPVKASKRLAAVLSGEQGGGHVAGLVVREPAIVDLDLAQDGDDRHEEPRRREREEHLDLPPRVDGVRRQRGPESGIARAVVPGEAGVGDPAGPFGSTGHAVDRVMLEV